MPSSQLPQGAFSRTELLLGSETMKNLDSARVLLFGVGGVGSWCAEALVRTGIGHLEMVDPDVVAPSNLNRQLPATVDAIGQPKVEVLRHRLLSISPQADITARQEKYTAQTAAQWDFNDYDYIIDAIDSLADKALLILTACRSEARLFSSMGAALKMDPQHVAVAEFWKVKGCPLARALRQKFKREGTYPSRKFRCVYSDELLRNNPDVERDPDSPRANGTLMHITAIFGLTLASMVIRDSRELRGS